MKKVILEGDERIVDTIIRENRVRVSRGNVKFTPADSTPTPEGVTEEDVRKMADAIESQMDAIEQKDARIAELLEENDALKAALKDKAAGDDAPENPDTKGAGDDEETGGEGGDTKESGETDTKEAPEGDTKDAPENPDTKEGGPTDTKGKKSSKK